MEHAWYDWVMYWDSVTEFPEPKEALGRWLGPSIDIGPAMTSKVLKKNGQYIHTSMVRGMTDDEMHNPKNIKLMKEFDKAIEKRLGKPLSPEDMHRLDPEIVTPEYEFYEDDVEGTAQHVPDIDDATPEEGDQYIAAEVNLPVRGNLWTGTVKRQARDDAGELQGTRNQNPILDTCTYQVEFPDGQLGEYSANIIAENMYAQCDGMGNQHLLMSAIVDHRSDNKAMKHAN